MPPYNGLRDSYVVDSIGYRYVIGVLKRRLTHVGVITLFFNHTLEKIYCITQMGVGVAHGGLAETASSLHSLY